MTEWHPVAWKRGTESKKAGWVLAPVVVPRASPCRSAVEPRELMKKRLIKFVHMLRWVPTAPLGRPVVPDV